jgi:hypothetical protein
MNTRTITVTFILRGHLEIPASKIPAAFRRLLVTQTFRRPKVGFIYTSRKIFFFFQFSDTYASHHHMSNGSKWNGNILRPSKWLSLCL